jgi:hypothetical protein
MNTFKWVLVAAALIQGGWFVFDGTRAFVLGDYVTARTGSRAGQLGPWSRLIARVGLDPRSNFVKGVHVFLGMAWLAGLILLLLRPESGRWMLLCCAIASLWYLPMGTVLSGITIAVLAIARFQPT